VSMLVSHVQVADDVTYASALRDVALRNPPDCPK
jgi:hypothetical protein